MGVDEAHVARIFVAASRDLHREIREAIGEREEAALNWTPAPGANSVATLVTHTLGSEREVVEVVRGLPTERDRPGEFAAGTQDAAALIARLDAADALLDEHATAITTADLAAKRVRPSAQKRLDARSGTFWLINCYAHGREHLGHIELTLQLFDARA